MPLLRRAALLVLALGALAGVGIAALWAAVPDVAPLARENPRTTALIEQRRAEAREKRRPFRPRQVWVAPDRLSPASSRR